MSWSDNQETHEKLASYIKQVLEVDEPAVRYIMALNFIASSYAEHGDELRFGSFACAIAMTAKYPQDYK